MRNFAAHMVMRKLLLVLIVLYAADSLGGVYKCTDANGRIVYSDTACDAKADRKAVDLQPLAEVKANEPFLSRMANKFKSLFQSTSQTEQANSASASSASANKSLNARCDGRTRCSQMTSCEEATFFIKNCPDTQMDGDNDGIPCESQWCQ